MNTILRKTRDFIFAQQAGIISSTILISGMLLLARVFGFARYRVLNGYFTKEELDLYYAAFRIPDFVFEILITGGLVVPRLECDRLHPRYSRYIVCPAECERAIVLVLKVQVYA